MSRRSKALLDRVERVNQSDQPLVVLLSGNPEPTRRLGRQMSSREAMIETELFSALDGESVKQFHRRLASIARERVMGLGRKITIVSIGDDEPVKECLFNLNGTLKTPPGQAEPLDDATRH